MTVNSETPATAMGNSATIAFAGAVFPVESASGFARVWSALLPYSSFAKLLSEQWIMGSAASVSLRQIIVMLPFVIVGLAVGLPRYLAAAKQPETWGRR